MKIMVKDYTRGEGKAIGDRSDLAVSAGPVVCVVTCEGVWEDKAEVSWPGSSMVYPPYIPTTVTTNR